MDELFDTLAREDVHHLFVWSDKASGLQAVAVIDDVTLGPAAGGIRTQPYPSWEHAIADAARLARAMTLKCALAGLNAGGGKIIVAETPRLSREPAFTTLGRRIDDLGGLFRAGSDLGTGRRDLEAAGAQTEFVHTDLDATTDGVARGVVSALTATVEEKTGQASLEGIKIAVQGCGAVGESVARALAARGATLCIADVDRTRAEHLGDELSAIVLNAEDILTADVDVVSPCAVGRVITATRADNMRAWAICGGANNQLDGDDVAQRLQDRGVLYVPDIIASAGGVVDGIGRDVMGLDDRSALIDALGPLTREVLQQAQAEGTTTLAVARARALARLDQARRARG